MAKVTIKCTKNHTLDDEHRTKVNDMLEDLLIYILEHERPIPTEGSLD